MSDYTPTAEAIRGRIIQRGIGWGFYGLDEFDRWLAAHDAEKRAEWEGEHVDKPAPCVMTHTPPFDFAQCETHDETFPLGGACKWDGKESIAQVLEDEADEQRARAVHAEHELEMLRAEQGETEWEVEHGLLVKIGGNWAETEWEPEQFDEVIAGYPHNEYVRAERKVTPWLPAPDTTNNESEDEK